MHDKRLTKRLTDYWNRLRKEKPLPRMEHFNAGAIDDIISRCCLWRVEIQEPNSRFPLYTSEYVGRDVKEAIGEDITGETISPCFRHFPAARILDKIGYVVENAVIITDEGQFVNDKNKVVKYRTCLLPFGNKAGKVTNVLLGMSWRAF